MNSARTSALLALGTAFTFLLPCSAAYADEASAEVAKPQVKVGDRWAYQRTNQLARTAPITFDTRVASTGADEIVMVSKRRDREGEVDSFWTSEWNTIALQNLVFTPHLGHFKFPLKVGATYVAKWDGVVKSSGWSARYEVPFKVTGWEDITVPAGKFRALKLEGRGSFSRLDQGGAGWMRMTYWYAPEVKRFVKSIYEQGTGAHDNHSVDELVEFKVQ